MSLILPTKKTPPACEQQGGYYERKIFLLSGETVWINPFHSIIAEHRLNNHLDRGFVLIALNKILIQTIHQNFNLGIGHLAQGDTANALKEHEILKTLDTALADKLLNRINKK